MTFNRQLARAAVTTVALAAWTGIAWAQKPAPDAAPQKKPAAAPAQDKVYLTPTCGCCGKWVDHMIASGFKLERVVTTELESVAPRKRVPANLRSCHTAVIGKYLVEGHVPAGTIDRLLIERPDIRGVSLPGMPAGSPGMSGQKTEPFVIYEISDGPPKVYATE